MDVYLNSVRPPPPVIKGINCKPTPPPPDALPLTALPSPLPLTPSSHPLPLTPLPPHPLVLTPLHPSVKIDNVIDSHLRRT